MDIKNTKMTKNEIEQFIIGLIGEMFQIEITDINLPFLDYEISSIHVVPFVGRLEDEFGVPVPVSTIYSYSNVNLMADYIYKLLNKDQDQKETRTKETVQDMDKIAIVGMSCRFPAGADNQDKYWDVLIEGIDGIIEIPNERWDKEKYFDKDESIPGKMHCIKGGFLKEPVDEFDAGLFNISPKEAAYLDPHQRMLLELTWEAFENAGYDISKFKGSNVGVYLGLSSTEYALSGVYSGDLSKIGPYSLTGGCMSAICGRVSYLFGFEGPCFAVDTACSSSLTALHLACNAVKLGETDVAVVSGVNLILSPVVSIAFTKLGATSKDGHSKAFDANADGYARAEGGGVLLIKRLSEAIRDNDNILGVICATGINQDGVSNGLTAPNGAAQAKLMRKTLEEANLTSLDVDYIEMHGTGTKLGDPIEVEAVSQVYGENRTKENPLLIGSVKSNIGHLEPAAGIASIIKVLLAFKHKTIPANLHFNRPNPFINWEGIPVKVVDETTTWTSDRVRRAGVNGFGFGGSNAHVIIEEYLEDREEVKQENEQVEDSDLNYILKISAKSEKAQREYLFRYVKCLEECSDKDFADLIYTANRGRADFNYRLAVMGKNREEILNKLKGMLIGSTTSGMYYNFGDNLAYKKDRKIIFLFTGQGSQYVNMGLGLYKINKVFRESVDLCDKKFKPYLLKSLKDLIYGEAADNSVIQQTVYAQPLVFTIGYALAKMWESYGIVPDIVLGHSIGEYAAAVVAGIMSLDDAVKLVALRGRLMDIAPGEGSMGTIFGDEKLVNELIENYQPKVSIATINTKESYVISGDSCLVEEILDKAEEKGIRTKRLKVSHAFHSYMMEPILDDFHTIAKEVVYHSPKIRFVSTMFGREIDKEEILDADYWTNHILEKVDFYHAITSIEDSKDYIHLEIGANRVLSALCKLIFGEERTVTASLSIKEDDNIHINDTLAMLYVAGANVKWDAVEYDGKNQWRRMSIPNYPYDKSKYWLELHYDNRDSMPSLQKRHPLLGERFESPLMEKTVVFQRRFTAEEPYFMKEHIIFDTAISPAAAHVSFIISAMKELRNPASCTIKSIEFRIPLAVLEDEVRLVQICLQEKEKDTYDFSILSRDELSIDQEWQLHATGEVYVKMEHERGKRETDFSEFNTWTMDRNQPEQGTYALMKSSGFKLGDGFRRMIKTAHNDEVEGEYVCQIIPCDKIPDKDNYIIYPGTIDSVFQTGTLSEVTKRVEESNGVIADEINETIIPYFMSEFTYNYRDVKEIQSYVNIRSNDSNFIHLDVEAFNEKGELVISIKDLMARIILDRQNFLSSNQKNYSQLYYKQYWKEMEQKLELSEFSQGETYIVISDEETVSKIGDSLKEYGLNTIGLIFSNRQCKEANDLYYMDMNRMDCYDLALTDILSENPNKEFKIIFSYGFNLGYSHEEGKLIGINTDGTRAMFNLSKTLIKKSFRDKFTLKILTKNGHQVADEGSVNLSQASIWGFAKVFGMEYPEIFDGLIDIDDMNLHQGNFETELISKSYDEVCLRGNTRYVARIQKHNKVRRISEKTISKLEIIEDATYLITGGTGALGLVYAQSLINLGARNIILLCRKQVKEEVKYKIQQLRDQGVDIEIAYADICDEKAVNARLKEIEEKFPPIRGVIHAAGVLNDKLIEDMVWEDMVKVLDPKVKGTINLFNGLNKDSLDFIILLSSITSLIGNMGQSNYAAANYFINQFAEEMLNIGYPVYAMCWGPWRTGGMAADNIAVNRNMDLMGLTAFTNVVGGDIINQFFNKPINKLMIVDVDWTKMEANMSSSSQQKLISEITSESVTTVKNEEESNIIEILESLPSKQEKYDYLLTALQKVCSKVMGFSKGELVDTTVALREQGADSLMMFSMRTSLTKLLNHDIDVSTFFNYPTLENLTDYLLEDVLCLHEDEDDQDVLKELEEILNNEDEQ
ncbi:MAG: SDR family NAD(P)-dependent oxidoreductase [Clostridiales bacterium]|nr:SDR family NAD(P)-dependent oxidoreductase [Clostridiales bacterium]